MTNVFLSSCLWPGAAVVFDSLFVCSMASHVNKWVRMLHHWKDLWKKWGTMFPWREVPGLLWVQSCISCDICYRDSSHMLEYGLNWWVPWSRGKIWRDGDENTVMGCNKAVNLAKGVIHDVGHHALTIKIMIFTIFWNQYGYYKKTKKSKKERKSPKCYQQLLVTIFWMLRIQE